MPKKDKEFENQPEGTGMSRRDFAKLAAVSTAAALGSSVSMPKKTLAKPGKELARGAEEIYQCKNLKRFSMGNDTFILASQEGKGFWFNEYMRNKFENLKNSKIGESVPVKDAKEARAHMALMLGANFWNTVSNPYGNCFENMGMLSWKPLTVPLALQGNPDPDPDPEDLAKKVKQMGRVLGANEIGIAKLNRKWVYDETIRLNPLFLMEGGDPALMPGMPSMSGKGGMGLSPDQMKKFLGGPGGEPVQCIPKKIVFKDVKEPGENDTELIIPDSVRYAVVVLVDMNRLATQMGPSSSATDVATNMGYSRMAITEIALAEAIRAMGYNAIPSKNSVALSVPLAVDAGLGQVGRHGVLINPEYGPALRLGKVLTDMPLVPDKPIDFGVTEFCSECTKCAKHCPSSAISFGERSYEPPGPSGNPGALKWYVNGLKCLGYWVDSGGYCTGCQAVCPYTKGDFWGHGFIRGVSRSVPALDPFWTFMDDVFGYGKMRDPALMWDMKMSPFGIDTTKEV